jgi:signal transduction histidine kinase
MAVIVAAALLFALLLTTASIAMAGIFYMSEDGYYRAGSYSFYDSRLCGDTTDDYAHRVFSEYYLLYRDPAKNAEDAFRLQQFEREFAQENTNFLFTVTDPSGNVLLSNLHQTAVGQQRTYEYTLDGSRYLLNAYVKAPIAAEDRYAAAFQIYSTLYSMRYLMIGILAAAILSGGILFVFLMNAAGHRRGQEGIVLSGQDKIPLDLYGAAAALGLLLILRVSAELGRSLSHVWTENMWQAALLCLLSLAASFISLAACMTVAARLKMGRWWKNTIIYRILSLIAKVLRRIKQTLGALFSQLPLLWKTLAAFTAYALCNGLFVILFFMSIDYAGEVLVPVLWFLFNLAVLAGLCLATLQLDKLKKGGQKIAAGDFNWKIDTRRMLWDFKAHGESLNSIGDGMAKAVEEHMKSERLKTELITNVSHDLKTPLTSIVNYVDLLKKENIENQNVLEYIEVLDRQSNRLKKLTEDLVEASKASTGNLAVEPVRTDVVELLNQSFGEYTERFAESQLEAVIRTAQPEVYILADGRLLWRVFDNLLNNICKYSQPHTRVYLDVEADGGEARISLKNISKYPLNMSPEELLERFARGDSARTTEGSGLGLSIAKSLTELQKGSFELSVDGDLFKVIIGFDTIAE